MADPATIRVTCPVRVSSHPHMRRRVPFSAASMTAASVAAFVAGASLAFATAPAGSSNRAVALSSPAPSAALAAPSVPASAGPAPSPTPAPTSATSSIPSPTPPLPTPSPTPLTPEQRDALLLAELATFRATEAIPGIAATIEFPDGTSWTGVSGLADVARKRPVTPRTAFAVASVSKTFLSALILELAHEGRLRLDDRAYRYLPGITLDKRITIRMLLDHTSGLGDFFLNPKIDSPLRSDRGRIWSAEMSLSFVPKRYFVPGKDWAYSNTNYLLLGLLAERVGHGSLAEQYRARFIEPLGLGRTYYQVAERPRGRLATAYRFEGPGKKRRPIPLADGTGVAPFRSVVTAAGGAAPIAATSEDLARWARALYGGQVLDPASTAAISADLLRTAPFKPRIPYGLGAQGVTVDGLATLGHSGRLLGARAVMRYFPASGVSIAIVTNQSRTDPAILLARLALVAVPGAIAPSPAH
jgi:D-alanyl-D-alanine carboxypeptidase